MRAARAYIVAIVQQSERRQDRFEELAKENGTLAVRNRRLEEWTVEYRDRMHRAEVDGKSCSLRCRLTSSLMNVFAGYGSSV